MAFNRHFQDNASNNSRPSRFDPYGRSNSGRPSTLQDRLLGNHGQGAGANRPNVTQFNARENPVMDAKDRVTSTLKSLGIFKGDTGDSSVNFTNSNREGKDGKNLDLDLPLWDISALKQVTRGKRSSTRWSAPETSGHGSHSSTQQSSIISNSDQKNPAVGPVHQPQPGHVATYNHGGNNHPINVGSQNFHPSSAQNQAMSNYSSQSQHQSFGSSPEIPYNGPTQWPHHGHSGEGAPQRSSNDVKGMWNQSQSYTPQPQTHNSLCSGSNVQSWPNHENQPTFSQGGMPDLGHQQTLFPINTLSMGTPGSNLMKFKPPGGLFDTAKQAAYSKPARPNLKPLVEVTISNPAAMNNNPNQNTGKNPPQLLSASVQNETSGTKRKAGAQASPVNIKIPANQNTMEQIAVRNWKKFQGKVVLPGKNAGNRFKDDPERLQLVGKIAQGSQAHQMEILKLIGVKEDFTQKFLIPWKCYICPANCQTWLDYISHCTGKLHRNTVHSLGTDRGSEARKNLIDSLQALPLIPDAFCKSMVAEKGQVYDENKQEEEGITKEKEERENTIHACKACGKFYLKVDGLKRHKETQEHVERVQFLEERFGESWEQYQWYNQASQSGGQNAEEPVGVAFVVPISGFFCKLCSQFYNSEVKAKDVHCRQKNHIQKVKEWDRSSKGSMATLPVDLVEVAEAVRQNDKASSSSAPKESSKQPSRSRSRSKSRQDSRASSKSRDKKQDIGSSRQYSSKPDENSKRTKQSSSSEVKIPGLDLGILSEDVVEVSDFSDVSDEENFLSDKSEKKETSKRSLKEEGGLSASGTKQVEKDRELRERVRHWKQQVEKEAEERKGLRKKERENRERDKQRNEKEEKEYKEKMEKKWSEREKWERDALERERKEKEQLQKEKEQLEKEKEKLEREREEKKRQERERLRREKLEQEEREKLAKEKLERERLEQEQKEKERRERERLEKEKLDKMARERQRLEAEKKERERKEQERRERIRLDQERQIREEKRQLQQAKEQLESARRLQEQREKEFKDNLMRERSLMEKRIWEQQMREKELLGQQLRQQQLLEQEQLELEMKGKRMSGKERQEMEQKERKLEEQHLRERELKERELQEQQENELRRLQESQLKEQEGRHREMIEREQKETRMREEEQRQIEEQWTNLREREMRTEELLQANLQEQEIRDRQIREQGFIEWQRREEAMRQDGVPEREIMIRREMFDRELQEMAMRDAEIRAQQLGEVLHDPRGEVDLREKVIQQQQMRDRRERVFQELREKAQQELERKEVEMRRKGFPIAEIEEIIISERQMMEGQILEELRLRGLAGPEFEHEERTAQETEEDSFTSHDRSRDGSRSRVDRERSRERRDGGDERQERRRELSRHRDEEGERHRLGTRERQEVEEEMLGRQLQEEPGTSMGDLVVHERGGFRNVQIVDKDARHSVDPAEYSRERDGRPSRERGPLEGEGVERGVGRGRDLRATRGRRGRAVNTRGRARGRGARTR